MKCKSKRKTPNCVSFHRGLCASATFFDPILSDEHGQSFFFLSFFVISTLYSFQRVRHCAVLHYDSTVHDVQRAFAIFVLTHW